MTARLRVVTPEGGELEFELPAGRPSVLGRGDDADLRLADDPRLSRRHAELTVVSGRLEVKRLPGASNPVYHAGRAEDAFVVSSGETFAIGLTRFTFAASAEPAAAPTGPEPAALHTIAVADLYALGGASDGLRLRDLLELPEILRGRGKSGFYGHIAAMMRRSTGGSWACVVTEDGTVLGSDAEDAAAARSAPSRSLVRRAVADAPQPTIYSWAAPGGVQATVMAGMDWALCAGAKIHGEPAAVFYVAGRRRGAADAALDREKARFVGLVADMVGRSLSMDRLQTWEGRLEHYFAGPVVEKILKSSDLQELEPKLAVSTVLFFDIRGFSKRTEQNSREILGYTGELRRAMTAMTKVILEERGVVLQYMGDGILACWNVPFDEPDHADRACRSALRMAADIGAATGGWTCGIGLHTGEVVAGSIGSDQVFSYGLLGTVVNQASRVEGITKILQVPILVTREVAEKVSRATAVPVRLGRFRPAGMTHDVELFELTPTPGDPAREKALAAGLGALEAGRFAEAVDALDALPPTDRPAAYLRSVAELCARNPPPHWRGVIELTQK